MLTAREPSVKPLADVVRCYICCDGQHKSGNTRHFSHLPSRINGRARPQNHYTTRFAKKIQEMPRAGLSYRGKALSSYNLSVSLRSTAPLVGEPLAKPFTLRGLPKPPLPGEVARRRRDGEVVRRKACPRTRPMTERFTPKRYSLYTDTSLVYPESMIK